MKLQEEDESDDNFQQSIVVKKSTSYNIPLVNSQHFSISKSSVFESSLICSETEMLSSSIESQSLSVAISQEGESDENTDVQDLEYQEEVTLQKFNNLHLTKHSSPRVYKRDFTNMNIAKNISTFKRLKFTDSSHHHGAFIASSSLPTERNFFKGITPSMFQSQQEEFPFSDVHVEESWTKEQHHLFISMGQVKQRLQTDPLNILLLDARPKQEFELNNIISSVNIDPIALFESFQEQFQSFQQSAETKFLPFASLQMLLVDSMYKSIVNSLVKQAVHHFENQKMMNYEDRVFFRQREYCTVVLYANNHHLKKIYQEHYSYVTESTKIEIEDESIVNILHILKKEGLCKEVLILDGGFQKFAMEYPHFCANSSRVLTSQHSIFQKDSILQEKLEKVPHPDVIDSKIHKMTTTERLQIAHSRIFKYLTKSMDCELPSKILEHIYLGSAQNSFNRNQLVQLNIKFVLNTAKECVNHYPNDFHYLHCSLLDSDVEDISSYFDTTFAFLENARKVDNVVLVHCFMGMSRSAAIVVAYVMKYKKWNLKTAYKFVREKRPIIDINIGFMYQLIDYEKALFGSNSVKFPKKCFQSPKK